jgi:hypothetical protein
MKSPDLASAPPGARTLGNRRLFTRAATWTLGGAGVSAGHGAWACSACAPLVQARIYDGDFVLNLVLVVSPAVMLALLAWLVHGIGEPR